jgi:hypothetical protein
MSIERTFYCDGPECDRHVTAGATRPTTGVIFVTEGSSATLHFCTWDCVLKYAATKPPSEVFAVG